jgi:coenzyme F420 hydrogenase subunit beta
VKSVYLFGNVNITVLTSVASQLPVTLIRTIKTLKDVVDWGLCTGCGACYSACTEGNVKLVNVEAVGIRPRFDSNACAGCTKCLAICPGYTVNADVASRSASLVACESEEFGSALEIWEGHASDAQIRYRGSSGGVLSALAIYCLEHEGMAFVLHSAMDDARPWLNTTVRSRTRSEVLARAGSRYAPASPCEGLAAIEASDRPCVFIGKPCDTAAASMLRLQQPDLDRNLGLVLSFFCAGTPSTKGTLDLLQDFNVDKASVTQVRYRGEGWPGNFKVLHRGGEKELSYDESWGRLSGYRPLRCQLCPDGLGRVADISCGDAWDSFNGKGNAGRSLVIVRTPRGREILRRAIAANYVHLTPASPEQVIAAQPNLLQKRRELFGRLAALRLCMVPVPKFLGFSLLGAWLRLPFSRQARTVFGTFKRILIRGLWRQRRLFVDKPTRRSMVVLPVVASNNSPPCEKINAATASGLPEGRS